VWRFRSPHHFCRELVMRTSEPKPHRSIFVLSNHPELDLSEAADVAIDAYR